MTFFGDYHPQNHGWEKHPASRPYAYKGFSFPAGISAAPGYATVLTALLDALVPHIPGGLVHGWLWGGNYDDPTSNSFHEYFIAVDINAPANPKTHKGSPFGSLYVLPANSGDICRHYLHEWGGNFSADNPPDYMHVECHGTPDEVRALADAINAGTHPAPPAPVPPAPKPAGGHVAFPLPTPEYFGALEGPADSISGRSSTEGADLSAHRAAIAKIQHALNGAGLGHAGAPAQLGVDGQYGPATINAVKWFQGHHGGLTVDGECGPKTWAALGL